MSVQKNNGPIIDPALCRCCRAIKKCRILTAEYNWMGKKEVYADMVMDCYGILLSHVDDNEKDSGVCATCVVRLREAIAFRHQVLQCEDLFLQAKLAPPEEETSINYENKLKKLELETIELKTEPKDYASDHDSLGDDRDDALPPYSDDEDNKPLKAESKPAVPLPPKDEDLKSEDSEDYNGSSSDSDEPIKKKAKRKKKANGKEKKKTAKKQKADTEKQSEVITEETDKTTGDTQLTEEIKDKTTAPVTVDYIKNKTTGDTQLTEEIKDKPTAPVTIEEIKNKTTGDTQLTEEKQTTETKVAELTNEIQEHVDTQIALLTEEIHIKDEIEIEYSEESCESSEVPDLSGEPVKKKRMWVRDKTEGVSEYEQLNGDDDEIFIDHLNMTKSSFEALHKMVELQIEKTDTNFRKCISTRERLAICLRLLRTGYSFKEISTKYRVGRTTVSKIVKDVSRALWSTLQPVYMPAPKEPAWTRSETGYKDMYNFPNCVGSIGGRHVVAKQIKEDSEYPKVSDKACHKRFVTITLLAVTDPHHKILALDIGNYARDGHNILDNSKFFSKYMDKKDFLTWTPLPGDSQPCPHVLISTGSFTSRHNLVRPFPKAPGYNQERKVFNQYLSRACTVEKTFEMLMKSWTILLDPIEIHIDTAIAMIKAICCLHNYVLTKHGKTFPFEWKSKKPKKIVKGRLKKLNALKPFQATNHRASNVAVAVRDRFLKYFNRLGPVGDLRDINTDQNESIEETGSSDMTSGHFMSEINTVDTMPVVSNLCFDIKVETLSESDEKVESTKPDCNDRLESQEKNQSGETDDFDSLNVLLNSVGSSKSFDDPL